VAVLVAVLLVFGLAAAAPSSASASQDPLLGQQWALRASDPIGAREAWTRSTGRGVVVAVIDSGVQIDHPDLASNIWTNPGEVVNGVDDDANGYVDDVHGVNLLDDNANVADDEGHGTHIAGIVAARAGNGVGGSGLAPQAQIMPVKVSSAATVGSASGLTWHPLCGRGGSADPERLAQRRADDRRADRRRALRRRERRHDRRLGRQRRP